jgi:hypothetical protein
MKIAVKVEIDLFDGLNLREAAPSSAPFDAEDRTQGRFPRGKDRLLADLCETLRESDDGLAFAGDGRRSSRDENQFPAPRQRRVEQKIHTDFTAVRPSGLEIAVRQFELGRHVKDGKELFLHVAVASYQLTCRNQLDGNLGVTWRRKQMLLIWSRSGIFDLSLARKTFTVLEVTNLLRSGLPISDAIPRQPCGEPRVSAAG